MTTLFVAWQDSKSRRWFPIGKLDASKVGYEFCYTKGVLEAEKFCGFTGLQSFPELGETYESPELFPVFSNRVLPQSRPDYISFVQYLNLQSECVDPMTVLARSGGMRATDEVEVFPLPERTEDGKYVVHFFAHGVRYIEEEHQKVIESLSPGELLTLVPEPENAFDALAIQVQGQGVKLGYCPRYLNQDFHTLLKESSEVRLTVEKVNPSPAPVQLKLLCSLSANWPAGFQPFAGEAYHPVQPASAVPA
jgi:hypothetical protein